MYFDFRTVDFEKRLHKCDFMLYRNKDLEKICLQC